MSAIATHGGSIVGHFDPVDFDRRPGKGVPLTYASSILMFASCVIWVSLWITFAVVAWHVDSLVKRRLPIACGGAAMAIIGALGMLFALRQIKLRWNRGVNGTSGK